MIFFSPFYLPLNNGVCYLYSGIIPPGETNSMNGRKKVKLDPPLSFGFHWSENGRTTGLIRLITTEPSFLSSLRPYFITGAVLSTKDWPKKLFPFALLQQQDHFRRSSPQDSGEPASVTNQIRQHDPMALSRNRYFAKFRFLGPLGNSEILWTRGCKG